MRSKESRREYEQPHTVSWRSAAANDAEWMFGKSRVAVHGRSGGRRPGGQAADVVGVGVGDDLPESVRRLTSGLASPGSSSAPDARWRGGRVTGGSREAVWADTKRGDALSA